MSSCVSCLAFRNSSSAKDRNKMERKLGRIQAQNSSVNDLYEITLQDTPEGLRLVWQMKQDRKRWRELREGACMLRTDLQAETAKQLWSKYMQLTEAATSFPALKRELSNPPALHPIESPPEARSLGSLLV